ncbi:SpoIIE family protein phosphatase [Zooshikella harenae]|uniref:Response regulator n=1 Tax=Zooshikella harenae TaxID=2827238 RepID=A0ABS5ZEG3_9GAMM|nr:SpoIIE family protein phosphatase [Zooshikella harenae]MBU2712459.1 response regulator [Zooshikella harenae]
MNTNSSKLLVIDDEPIVRESIVAYLEDSGFAIIQAENGEEGIRVFKEKHPDLVICDLRMPKLDGLGVLKTIRGISPNTPVIVVSGAGVMSDVVTALRLGASDYLIKPIGDLEVLEHSINRALINAQLLQDNQRYRENLEEAIQTLRNSLAELQADQKAGRQVQLKMLPQSPFSTDDYVFAHHINPSLYLSGDFADYFPMGEHRFAFYLADVSGHGASSAFVTVLLKHMTMLFVEECEKQGRFEQTTPADLLDYLNQGLNSADLDKHVTMFCGFLDTKCHQLTYSYGGHFPFPLFATPDTEYYLEGHGLPVGLFDDATYANTVMDLPAQFSLTIFSDGIMEVLPQERLKDKEAYLLSIISEGASTVGAIVQALGLDKMQDAPDDIALLVLARNMS